MDIIPSRKTGNKSFCLSIQDYTSEFEYSYSALFYNLSTHFFVFLYIPKIVIP